MTATVTNTGDRAGQGGRAALRPRRRGRGRPAGARAEGLRQAGPGPRRERHRDVRARPPGTCPTGPSRCATGCSRPASSSWPSAVLAGPARWPRWSRRRAAGGPAAGADVLARGVAGGPRAGTPCCGRRSRPTSRAGSSARWATRRCVTVVGNFPLQRWPGWRHRDRPRRARPALVARTSGERAGPPAQADRGDGGPADVPAGPVRSCADVPGQPEAAVVAVRVAVALRRRRRRGRPGWPGGRRGRPAPRTPRRRRPRAGAPS